MEFHHLEYTVAPEDMFRRIKSLQHPVWLDSGYPANSRGRYDILSALPHQVLSADAGDSPESVERFCLEAQGLLDQHRVGAQAATCPFQGGLIGFWGYDLFLADNHLANKPQINFPCAFLGLYLWALIYDHQRRSASLVFHPACRPETRSTVLDLINVEEPRPDHEFELTSHFRASENRERYLQSLEQIKTYIRDGDVYQVNYAQHFQASYQGDTLSAYLNQRRRHPAPFSAYIGLDRQAVISHSPEEFLRVQGREVQTQPIKGTAPRATDPKIDQRNADVLQASAKDRAENLMIVDLLRNDLGKACEPGSISVPSLFELQSFSNVHHLVSKVRGSLRPEVSVLELLRHCHPGGSITGAPKKRAMEIIAELEVMPRSLYCGSIGYISLCGHSHTSIAIRTMIADGAHIHCWGGGGIVHDSNIEKEFQETLYKVAPMMESLEQDFLSELAQPATPKP